MNKGREGGLRKVDMTAIRFVMTKSKESSMNRTPVEAVDAARRSEEHEFVGEVKEYRGNKPLLPEARTSVSVRERMKRAEVG